MEVANLSNVLEGTDDCLEPNFRKNVKGIFRKLMK